MTTTSTTTHSSRGLRHRRPRRGAVPFMAPLLFRAGAAGVPALWWSDTTSVAGPAGCLTGAGRITGLLAGYACACCWLRWPAYRSSTTPTVRIFSHAGTISAAVARSPRPSPIPCWSSGAVHRRHTRRWSVRPPRLAQPALRHLSGRLPHLRPPTVRRSPIRTPPPRTPAICASRSSPPMVSATLGRPTPGTRVWASGFNPHES